MSAASPRPGILRRLADPGGDVILLAGVINGHVTWSLQLLINYMLDGAACDAAAAGATQLAGYEAAMVAVTAVMAGITTAVLIGCVRALRLLRSGQVRREPDEIRRRSFMAMLGIMLSGLFVLVILFGGTLHLTLAPCIRG
jgi:hypothetical protein